MWFSNRSGGAKLPGGAGELRDEQRDPARALPPPRLPPTPPAAATPPAVELVAQTPHSSVDHKERSAEFRDRRWGASRTYCSSHVRGRERVPSGADVLGDGAATIDRGTAEMKGQTGAVEQGGGRQARRASGGRRDLHPQPVDRESSARACCNAADDVRVDPQQGGEGFTAVFELGELHVDVVTDPARSAVPEHRVHADAVASSRRQRGLASGLGVDRKIPAR